jgi:uncharacterized protein
MTKEAESKAVVQRYVAALQAGDEGQVRTSFAEEASWTIAAGDLPIAGSWEGRDAILDGFLATALSYYEPARPASRSPG